MNELDYMQAQEHAEGKGDAVTAVYHSHVGAGVYFSEEAIIRGSNWLD